tara:strand:- start:582 stop:722 length:141 start_codon:yes stop_codon:yes gene_type:complete
MSSFDTKEEALQFASILAESLKDGRVSVSEWGRIGKAAGIFKGGRK